jgi:hypothetical protein
MLRSASNFASLQLTHLTSSTRLYNCSNTPEPHIFTLLAAQPRVQHQIYLLEYVQNQSHHEANSGPKLSWGRQNEHK